MKILKFILKLLGGLVALLVAVGVVAFNWDAISFQYDKLFWEPNGLSLEGVSLGDTRSEVVFMKGKPSNESSDILNYYYGYDNSRILSIGIGDSESVEVIGYQAGYFSYPFRTVEKMKEILGEEDILAVSQNFISRRYTYLEWEITYEFVQNRLNTIIIGGKQGWKAVGETGEYIVKGRVVCPGNECPWNEDGELKPEYEDKDYRVFLP